MFCALIQVARKLPRNIAKAVSWLTRRLRRAWTDHLERVGANPGYAAAAAALLAGGLGLMAAHAVIGAVLAGLLGVYVRGVRDPGGPLRGAATSYDSY